MANYNITMTQPKVTIHCKDKTMQDDLVITAPSSNVEEWDGSYEEIKSGYTLTLEVASGALNNDYYTYSLNDGSTWNQFTSATMILENVTQIKFKSTSSTYYLYAGTTSGAYDVAYVIGNESENYVLAENKTLYIAAMVGGVGD